MNIGEHEKWFNIESDVEQLCSVDDLYVCVCVRVQSQTNVTPANTMALKIFLLFFFPLCLSLLKQLTKNDEFPYDKRELFICMFDFFSNCFCFVFQFYFC